MVTIGGEAMNRYLLLIVILASFVLENSLIASDAVGEPLREVMCVSLGWNCHPAVNLLHNNIRFAAFPFDWNQTSFYGLCGLLENSFADFLNPAYLICPYPGCAGAFNTKYNTALSHDFPFVRDPQGIDHVVDNYVDHIPSIQEKYNRRIKRLYAVSSMAKKIYFFRLCPSSWGYDIQQGPHEMEILRDVLRRLFPHNNWTLVVIKRDHNYKNDWGMPQVKNFYISQEGNRGEWEAIFRTLGLI